MKKLIAMTLLVVQASTMCFAETLSGKDRKGITATDDVSKGSSKSSDKTLNNIKPNRTEQLKEIQTTETEKAVSKTVPESARKAVMALKRLQARCTTGISLKDYTPALENAKSEVTMFVNSKETKDSERLKELIVKAMDNYQKAGDSMREGLNSVQSLRSRIFQAALQGTELDSAPLLLSPDGQVPVDVDKSNNDIVARYIRTASYILQSVDKIMNKKK